MDVICYACGRGEYPENTIEAIQHCQNVNVDWRIEMDLQLSKDGKIVLFHDYNTERTTGAKKNIFELLLDEIKALNAGYNFRIKDEFSYRNNPIQVPTLKEVCQLFPKAKLLLDVHTDNPHAVAKIINILAQYGQENDIVIVSKYDGILEKFKSEKPYWVYGAATTEVKKMVYSSFLFLDNFFPLQSSILMLPVNYGRLTLLTNRVLKHVKKRRKKIWVWLSEGKEVITIQSYAELLQLDERNVDGIFTEYPEKLKNEINSAKGYL